MGDIEHQENFLQIPCFLIDNRYSAEIPVSKIFLRISFHWTIQLNDYFTCIDSVHDGVHLILNITDVPDKSILERDGSGIQ